MDVRDTPWTGSASGVARLVLVVAALIGFLAMHGFDMTDGAGSHHAAPVAVSHAMGDESIAVHPPAPTAESGSDQAPLPHDAVMAGCLFVLLALAGTVALQLLATVNDRATTSGSTLHVLTGRPARAPPCPVFISLCVFRL